MTGFLFYRNLSFKMLKLCFVYCMLVDVFVLAFAKRLFEASRTKRVINGYVPVVNKERPFEYDVVRYSAWIGAASSCASIKKVQKDIPYWWMATGRRCFPDVDDQRCMGALIHPRIVQTAGHCVGSHVLSVDNSKDAWAPGRVWSVWEDMLQVYVGYTDVEDFLKPAYARFFIQHPKYAQLRNTQYAWVSHDFGWIILNSEPTSAKKWANIVAPVLTASALEVGADELISNQEVCLFAGFGAWQLTDKEVLNTTSSQYLRYGWQLTTSYQQCWYFLQMLTGNWKLVQRKWKYKKYATWFCHIPFGGHLTDHPGVGDSGGPVHCNGRMLALLSGGKWQNINPDGSSRTHVTRTMGLSYSLFENAAEFRAYFVKTVKSYARVRQYYSSERRWKRHSTKSDSAVIEYSMKSTSRGNIHVSCTILTMTIILRISLFEFSQHIY